MSEFMSEPERYLEGVILHDIYFDELALDSLEKLIKEVDE